jgi:hypothetical protein
VFARRACNAVERSSTVPGTPYSTPTHHGNDRRLLRRTFSSFPLTASCLSLRLTSFTLPPSPSPLRSSPPREHQEEHYKSSHRTTCGKDLAQTFDIPSSSYDSSRIDRLFFKPPPKDASTTSQSANRKKKERKRAKKALAAGKEVAAETGNKANEEGLVEAMRDLAVDELD